MNEIHTLQDLVAHCLDMGDLQSNDDVNLRRAIRAARYGFQQASQRKQWTFDEEKVLTFNAAHTDGTIDVDAAGVVTLSGSTWPSWADEGSIVVGDDSYRVKTRDSDTQLTLEDWTGIAVTDESYSLAHDRMLISHDVRTVYDIWNQDGDYRLIPMEPQTFRERKRWQLGSGGTPLYATIRRLRVSGKIEAELRITPFPTETISFLMAYIRRPNQPVILHHTGNLAISSGSVTLDNKLPPTMDPVGAWLRVSTTESTPDADLAATIFESVAAEWEGEILTVDDDGDSLTVSSDAPDVTDRGGVISDTLDLPPFAMNAARLYAESHMTRYAGGDDNVINYRRLQREADQELRYASEQDGYIQNRQPRYYYRAESFEPYPYIVGGATV